ncbi:MAG: ABC transporter permease [Gemmatimonadaceae bacterium]
MKFFGLLTANLGRAKWRTTLTIASVALALFLFASLRTVLTTLDKTAQFGSARRLITTNSTGFTFPMPISYAARLQTIEGVTSVTWLNWFGGRYGDGKRFFANFAVDAESYLAMYPEMSVPPEQKAAFLADRGGAIIGARLVDLFGWQVGQNVTLQGTIYPGEWTFTVRGIYTPTNDAISDDAMFFHWEYFDERTGREGEAGWYTLEIDRAENAANIASAVDATFKNSSDPTKTGTEQAFNASFATMFGNISLLLNTIGTAVVFAILLVTANAMMMSTRERGREYAIMKAVGFTDRQLFLLVLAEAGGITLLGALIGLGGAKALYKLTNFNAGGFLPGFDVSGQTVLFGTAIALLLMLASGIAPALRAARLSVVSALRNVE